MIFGLALVGVVLGLSSFGKPESGVLPFFYIVAYFTLIVAVVWTVRTYNDWFNLLFLLLFVGIIRLHIPAIFGRYDDPTNLLFAQMHLSPSDWTDGHILGLLGAMSLIMGWMISPSSLISFVRTALSFFDFRRSAANLVPVSTVGWAIGLAAIFSFVELNGASVLSLAQSGDFRNTSIQSGTGYLFWIGVLSIGLSSMLAAALLRSNKNLLVVVTPALIVAAAFWILGGRFRAMAPMLSVALIIVYERRIFDRNFRVVLTLMILLSIMVPYVLFAGNLYRNGLGVSAFQAAANVPKLTNYTVKALGREIGQTFSLAGAARLDPGVLRGQSFNALLWPASNFLGISGRSSGKYIIESLVGADFAIHPSLIGDVLLNYGLVYIPFMLAIVGLIARTIYVAFRMMIVPIALYAILTVNLFRIYYESIDKYKELLVIFLFMLLFYKISEYLVHSRRA